MNVLYVGNRLSGHGSALTGIELLGPMLEQRGYKLRYASTRRNKALRLLEMIGATFRLRNWAQWVLIDTYSTSNFWYTVIVALLCRLFKIPYIPILHGGNLPSRLENSPRLSRFVFGHSTINIAPSGYLHKAFADAGFKVCTIPNPVSVQNFPFRERLQVSPTLLWVRGLGPMSNPQMALQVTAIVTREFPDARICLVGPDPLKMQPELERLASQLKIKAQFTGKLTQSQWAALSQEFDIFLNTSRVDNAPFSLIEAMSLGLYVISTKVGGIGFVARDHVDALLVPGDDTLAMADAVFKILRDPGLRERLRLGAMERARQFSPDVVLAQWDEILAGPV